LRRELLNRQDAIESEVNDLIDQLEDAASAADRWKNDIHDWVEISI